jgi:hypothetical protein
MRTEKLKIFVCVDEIQYAEAYPDRFQVTRIEDKQEVLKGKVTDRLITALLIPSVLW